MPTEIRIISHSNVFYDLFSGLLGPLLELVRGLDCFKDLRRAPNPSRSGRRRTSRRGSPPRIGLPGFRVAGTGSQRSTDGPRFESRRGHWIRRSWWKSPVTDLPGAVAASPTLEDLDKRRVPVGADPTRAYTVELAANRLRSGTAD